MKLSDFILMNEEEKKQAVLHEGILVAKRNNQDGMVFLFQLPTYYVEAFCNTESRKIEEYRVFDSMKALHPYLEAIHIDDLIN